METELKQDMSEGASKRWVWRGQCSNISPFSVFTQQLICTEPPLMSSQVALLTAPSFSCRYPTKFSGILQQLRKLKSSTQLLQPSFLCAESLYISWMAIHGVKELLLQRQGWPHYSCAAKCWIIRVTLWDAIYTCHTDFTEGIFPGCFREH